MKTFLYNGQRHTIASYLSATQKRMSLEAALESDLWTPAERQDFLDNEEARRWSQLLRENPGAGLYLEKSKNIC